MPGTASSPSTSPPPPPPVRVSLAASNLLPFPCASLAHLFLGIYLFLGIFFFSFFSSWAPFWQQQEEEEEEEEERWDWRRGATRRRTRWCRCSPCTTASATSSRSVISVSSCASAFFASVTSFSPPIQWWRCNFFPRKRLQIRLIIDWAAPSSI
jgi:hypothetical protein